MSCITLYPSLLIRGKTLAVNSGYVPTRYSVVEIPTEMSKGYIIRTTVCFIHSNGLRTTRWIVFEDIFLWRIPEHGIVYRGVREILCHPFDPDWESVDVLSLWCGHGDLRNQRDIKIEILP